MRIAAIGLAILVVLLLGVLLAAPRLIDANRFKGDIAAALEKRTGLQLELTGPLGISFLPSPVISAREVRLANPPGAALPDMVRLRALEVKPALWPLLSGKLELRSATLVDADIDLEILPDGTANWLRRASSAAPSAEAVPSEPPAAPQDKPDAARSRANLAIDRLLLQNATVTYRSGAKVERFEHINATVSLGSLAGPFQAQGELVARGAGMSFEASLGRLDEEEAPVHLALTAKPAGRLNFEGLLGGRTSERSIKGRLKVTAEDLATLASLARLSLPGALAQPVVLTGDLSGSAEQVALDHLALDLGTAHGQGKLLLRPGKPLAAELTLSVGRLDLDRWLAARKAEAAPPAGAPDSLGATAALAETPTATVAIPAAGLSGAANFTLPPDLDLAVDLGVEAILWRNGLIRDARFKARIEKGQMTLERLAALLPGGSDLAVSGTAATEQGTPRFEGLVKADADDLRSLVGWLGVALDDFPADRLRKAALSTRATLAGERLDLRDIDVMLDATHLTGAATVALRQRLGLGLRLVADKLNIDAYLPRPTPSPPAASAPVPPSAAPAPALPATPSTAVLGRFDANIDARIEALTWRGQPLRDLHLAGTLQSGDLTLHDLSLGDLGGAAGSAKGSLAGLAGDAPTGQIGFDLQGPEFEHVLRLIAPSLAAGQSFGVFSLSGSVQAGADGYALNGDLDAIGGSAHLEGAMSPARGAADIGFALDHPNFTALMRSISPAYRPAGGELGPVKLSGRLKGEGAEYRLEGLALALGQSTLEGSLGIKLGGARPTITADLKLGDWTIDRLLTARQSAALDDARPRFALRPGVLLAQAGTVSPPPDRPAGDHWSREPIDLAVLGLVDGEVTLSANSLAYGKWRISQATAAASLREGTVQVSRLAGGLFGGAVEAKAVLEGAAAPKLSGQLTLRNADLQEALSDAGGIGLVSGRFDIDADFAGNGASSAELVAHLGGTAMLKGRDGRIYGIDLKTVNDRLKQISRLPDLLAVVQGGAGGSTAFSTLEGSFRIEQGVATSDDLRLVTEGGEGRATAVIDLPRYLLQSRVEFRLADFPDAPALVMRLDGPLDAPRKAFDASAMQPFIAQHLLNRLIPADQGKPGGDSASPDQAPPAKPDKVLKDLLKGIFQKP